MKLISLSIPMDLSSGSRSIHAILLDGNTTLPVSIADDHPRWDRALNLVNDLQAKSITPDQFAEDFSEVVSVVKELTEKFVRIGGILDGRMSVSPNGVTVDYEPIDSVLESHILRMLNADGTPKDVANWSAFSNFIENLYKNQDDYVRQQLFGWIAYETLHGTGLTLTPDGCFIGYKGCMGTPEDAQSIRTGTAIVNGVTHKGHIPNPLGAVVEMPRSQVIADPAIACGPGLHVGTHDYAKSWARGVVLTVKVNPRDVVSVPVDCGAQKMRTCRYEVIESVEHAYEALTYSEYDDADFDHLSDDEADWDADDEISETIHEALWNSDRVKISYVDSRGQASIRVIQPESVSGDVVTAFCENADGTRSFIISEIRSAEILEDEDDDDNDECCGDPESGCCLNSDEDSCFIEVDLVELLNELIAQKVDLEIDYANSKGESTLRVITPDRITDANTEDPRLLAYCHTADDFRTFRLSSLISLALVSDEDEDPEVAEEVARNGYADSPPAL